jgi:hypothetical protein
MLEKSDFCCEAWIENVEEVVEMREDGLAINGCCGGGCFVIHGIKFCPFCGKKIFEVKK